MKHAALVALLLAVACGGESNESNGTAVAPAPVQRPEETLGGRPMSEFFIEHDRFFPATDPGTVSRAEAAHLLGDDEVFGVLEGGKARAYPVTMLSYYHVVNDIVGGVPIAVTY